MGIAPSDSQSLSRLGLADAAFGEARRAARRRAGLGGHGDRRQPRSAARGRAGSRPRSRPARTICWSRCEAREAPLRRSARWPPRPLLEPEAPAARCRRRAAPHAACAACRWRSRSSPDANLALISTPGDYAAAEAMKALRLGLNVMLFSDNVALDDEIALKRYAREHDLLVMGPDCGTAIINGIPLGFANAVRRGAIGVVGASGTGLQQVTCLVAPLRRRHLAGDRHRRPRSQRAVGGITMLQGLERARRRTPAPRSSC